MGKGKPIIAGRQVEEHTLGNLKLLLNNFTFMMLGRGKAKPGCQH
jgi:hypothetical protein